MMEDDEILKSLKEKAMGGETEAVKALLEYKRAKQYKDLIKGLDDDEFTDGATLQDQFQFN